MHDRRCECLCACNLYEVSKNCMILLLIEDPTTAVSHVDWSSSHSVTPRPASEATAASSAAFRSSYTEVWADEVRSGECVCVYDWMNG